MRKINFSSTALYILALIISSVTSYYIVLSNYRMELYSSERDIIAIPIMSITAIFSTLLLCTTIQILVYNYINKKNKFAILLTLLTLATTLLSATLLIGSIIYWIINNHLSVGLLYLMTIIIYCPSQRKIYKSIILTFANSKQ